MDNVFTCSIRVHKTRYMCYILRHYNIEHSNMPNFHLICNVNNCEHRYSTVTYRVTKNT